MPGAGNEDLGERVYILFKRLSAGAGERDSGNVLCYNSVVVPPRRSDNRLANGKPSITISLLFHQCLHSPLLCKKGAGIEVIMEFCGLAAAAAAAAHPRVIFPAKAIDALPCQHVF